MTEKYNLTVRTNNELFLGYRHPSSSLEIEVAKEGGEVDENGQIELPWERGTEINHVSIFGWEKFEGIVEKLRFRAGEGINLVIAEIKNIKVDKCWVEDMDIELNPGKKRLKIPAWACQSIEFTKEGETFPYDITAEEVKDPDLVRLDELKEEADILCKNIINTTETAKFSEETIGNWFKRTEEIKFESGSIVLKLKGAEKTAGNRKSAEIKKIFEKRLFRDKREYFLDKAENFYIEKIEKLGRKDEQINNINFIKEGHYDDWKDYIREQDAISGIMKCANDDLLPAVQAIPLVTDRAETEFAKKEVREEVGIEVKKSLQTSVPDKNEKINISENQTSAPSISTDITNTENHTNNNFVPRTETLPAENSPPTLEIDLNKYESLWQLIKNTTQLEELNRKELKDINIDRLKSEGGVGGKIFEWKKQKQNLKYIRDLKKELLTRGFTDEELTNELQQQKRENLQPGPENDWYCLFKSQVSNKIQTKNEIQRIIIELAEIKAWEKFFAEKGIIDPNRQKKWKQTELLPISNHPRVLPQTERAWQRGWRDLTDPNITRENCERGEINYLYQEIIEGENKKSFLRIKLYSVNYSDIEIFASLIDKINEVNVLGDIEIIKEESDKKIKEPLIRIRIIETIKNKTKEFWERWERFFNLHPEIDTLLKKRAWIKSGLNPVESLAGKADSQADIAWGKGWTDLTINSSNDGIGEIKVINDDKVEYWSYEQGYEFDSFYSLLLDNRKDDLDKELFWTEFKENYDKKNDDELIKDKAEKWRQKGYLPSEAAKYQKNHWDAEEVDEEEHGWANYKGKRYNMNQSKLTIEKGSVVKEVEIKEKKEENQSEIPAAHYTAELRREEKKDTTITTITTKTVEESSEVVTPFIIRDKTKTLDDGSNEQPTNEPTGSINNKDNPEISEWSEVETPIKTLEPTSPSEERPSRGKRAVWGAIALVVVGAIGAGIGKWLQNRKKTKISGKTN